MITAIDTNVLFDILIPNQSFVKSSARALENSAAVGSLVICDLVYSELCIHFPILADCNRFLEENDIRVERISQQASFAAGSAWRAYLKQSTPNKKSTRILPDFLIAAHAQTQATRFLSRDSGFYRKAFPNLVVLDPSQ